ncbi:hypothetical protein M2451_002938 [Dysgonomonas sp. PFB1-18]|uniref:type VI secretion system contractile sheath protein TssC n=1 Tax=unclassified Dysgonomonas TaxID=2630389 RepID=UPI0013D86911|nr:MULTISPECIES: type VI secretion system contractile sheath protein TssC [unclassified Dysgonomonas]MDH6310048.1 hypothetical protein [Dysgonomonas sp. PF1-14]MDH6339957.1 hypothetical protein [Dysgonomonas sp. PF1-16]MDH6381605.1 hypothetical protein [Dysgonomonas sp. PFB1-18]MDH6398758.1 hypothetical protein [Dysgonomonas sp. PF1-23]NDV93603.1 type VI secretion system contractile sheath protein TssC [Dysgonomonas sp. 521]
MAEEKDTAVAPEVKQGKSKSSAPSAKEAINNLIRFGGFGFLESIVSGIAAMNPDKVARKTMFLNDEEKKGARQNLTNELDLWLELLESTNSISEMLAKAEEKATSASSLLSKNQLAAVDTVFSLEQSYRNVMLFYKNTESDKLTNISVVNASRDQITDLDNSRFIDHVSAELKQNFDRLDLRNNYSYLVIPGWLKKTSVVDKWGNIANENKVGFFTDFRDLESPDDVIDEFSSSGLASAEIHKSKIRMSCNWLMGRGKYAEIGEKNDMHVSPAAALAGKVYSSNIAQISAGKKHGVIREVDSVVFSLKKSEISQLEKLGLIPMVHEYGSVMAFSGKTLFTGDNLGLQTYSVVGVFDYITKVLFDFLNRRAFENWSGKTERDLRSQIIKFLDGVQGPDRLIEKFKIVRFERDPNQKDRIYLDIHLTPFFPAKSFVIKLDGTKGEEENTWNTDIEQQ